MPTVPGPLLLQTPSIDDGTFVRRRANFRIRFAVVTSVAILLGLLATSNLWASPPATQSTQATAWDDVDQRMVFFTVQLASVETSLDAVNKSLKAAGYKISVREDDATRYQKGNELMDRNAGGPVRWDEFYGRTAEKFFYNPAAPPGTMRLTVNVLQSNPFDERGQRPPDQRPPQFDYIYRANSNAAAQADADVAKLAGKVDALLARKRQLEDEQSALWCKASFRPVAARELLRRPMYRFQLKSAESGQLADEHLQALTAAMDFLRISNALLQTAENGVDQNQPGYYATFQTTVANTRGQLDDSVMKQADLIQDAFNPRTTLGTFEAVAKRMDDVAKNVDDAFKLAQSGQAEGDESRKATFRGQLQASLVIYAEAVLAGDECVRQLADDWKISPNVHEPAQMAALPPLPTRATQPAPPPPPPATDQGTSSPPTKDKAAAEPSLFDFPTTATQPPVVVATAKPAASPVKASAGTSAASTLAGDQIDEVVTLSSGTSYLLNDDYRVPAGKELVIEDGVTVICNARRGLNVAGKLTTSGKADRPVIFRGYKPGPANWKGITLEGSKDSDLKYLQVFDAEIGVSVYDGNATLTSCAAANNSIGITVGRYDSHHHAADLNDCLIAFNKSHGLTLHNSSTSLTHCTITHNGGIGIEGAYYPSTTIKSSVLALNEGGGIQLAVYDCKVSMDGCIIARNKFFDVNNKSTPEWDLRGNFWAPEVADLINKGAQLPNVQGSARADDPLTQMPKDCGAVLKELSGHKAW